MGRVQDKVVVVTGAANGLGEAIALRLAHAGAKMILADIDGPGLATTATSIRNDGGEVVTVVGDVTEEKPAVELIDAAIEHFGQLVAVGAHEALEVGMGRGFDGREDRGDRGGLRRGLRYKHLRCLRDPAKRIALISN